MNEQATIQSEMAVIGIMMLKPKESEKVYDTLTAKMFLSHELGIIFNCCKKLTQQGERADAVTVLAKLGDDYKELVMQAAAVVPSFSGFDSYITAVMDAWRVRTMKEKLFALYEQSDNPDEMTVALQEILKKQEKIMQHQKEDCNKGFDSCIMEFLKWMQQPDTSIKTGYSTIDSVTGGLQRGCVSVITARPSCGKTTLGLQMACNIAMRYKVLYISLEMTEVQLIRNIVARYASVSSQKIQNKDLTEEEQQQVARATDFLYNKVNLLINANSAQTVDDIERSIKAEHPDFVVIDHLRLLTPLDSRKKEFEASAENTHRLKQIAKDYNINIMELVQAKRESEGRVPQMADLFGGAATEQDADMIFGINPEAEYRELDQCEITVEVTKNRHGAGGIFQLVWQRPYCSMLEIAKEF